MELNDQIKRWNKIVGTDAPDGENGYRVLLKRRDLGYEINKANKDIKNALVYDNNGDYARVYLEEYLNEHLRDSSISLEELAINPEAMHLALDAKALYDLVSNSGARCSVGDDKEYYNEALLYKLFGVNAELLIDHSWGYEPCTMADVKSYRPENNSLSQGQVLQCPYTYDKAGLIVKEMTDILVLDLVDKGLVTNQIVLTIGYDIESLNDSEVRKRYRGEITKDRYGRSVPKHAHGTINLERFTSSTRVIIKKTMELYNRIIDKSLLVRRINVVANHVMREEDVVKEDSYRQLDIFTNYEELERIEKEQNEEFEKERHIQEAAIEIKKKFGKNALLKGMNFEEGATARDRNRQIGGHKA